MFQFQEIIFVDHQTGKKIFFKRAIQGQFPITAANNYGNLDKTYGEWHGVGANNYFKYGLIICDSPSYSGFLVSGYMFSDFPPVIYKDCNDFSWYRDTESPYFRTASRNYKGVAFNTNGARSLNNTLMSVGLR